jgi:hypothetical protein
MADPKEKEASGPHKPRLQEDRIVAQLVGSSGQAPAGLASYVGLLGRSPNQGRWRLYLSLDMSVHVEVKEEDIVHSEQLAADKSPFGGLGGTQIFVRKGAEVATTQLVSRTLEAGGAEDEFDLDIRLGGAAGRAAPVFAINTKIGAGGTCETCRTQCTCPGDSCATCQTQCGQATCTCQTQCGQATCQTCQTCQTQCGTCATCQTCPQTQCGTCATCVPCPTCVVNTVCL